MSLFKTPVNVQFEESRNKRQGQRFLSEKRKTQKDDDPYLQRGIPVLTPSKLNKKRLN